MLSNHPIFLVVYENYLVSDHNLAVNYVDAYHCQVKVHWWVLLFLNCLIKMSKTKKDFLHHYVLLPDVGVKWPVELGRELIIKWVCGWLRTLIFDDILFIVVVKPGVQCPPPPLPPLLPPPPPPPIIFVWCSRGGETGSDFTLMCSGDVEGGGVLFDTAKCGKPLFKLE